MTEERTINIVSSEGVMNLAWTSKAGEAVVVPDLTVATVDGLAWQAVLTVAWDDAKQQIGVRSLTIVQRGGGPFLPSRGLREFQLQGIVEEVVARTAQTVKIASRRDPKKQALDPRPSMLLVGGQVPYAGDPLPGSKPVSASAVKLLTSGRSRQAESLRRDRQRVVVEYQALRPDYEGPDIYKEIAERLNIGRTTVYNHLRIAGLVGKDRE